MNKVVKAVAPFRHKGIINFKKGAYDAWIKVGGKTASAHYLPSKLVGWSYNYELPIFSQNKIEARLRFIEPISRKLDAFPDYVRYEIIPMIWDCWPCLDDRISAWFEKHHVRTAIFTSKQNAERIQKRFPEMRILVITEGIDTSKYQAGKELKERDIDLLEFGRSNEKVLKVALPNEIKHICTKVQDRFIFSDEELFNAMGNAKVTIALPRCDTDPAIAAGVETLTQRYWENMLSRIVMVGRAPKELTDYIGYNPVIELDKDHTNEQIMHIITHIEDYQDMVNKNRQTALAMGDWTLRMRDVIKFLKKCNYIV